MKCSVIIPAYNSEKTITPCLESALNQDIPKDDYEVTLIDDGSTDNTQTIAKTFAINIFPQKNQGPAAARNSGAEKAIGDILIFTDSDCELEPDFVEKIAAPIILNPEIVGVQGSYKTKQKEFIARFVQIEIETRYQKMAKKRFTDFIGTYAAAYRKDVFHSFGGFDTGFPLASGEDAEFSYKLQSSGCKLVFEPQACVYHLHPSTLRSYMRIKFFRGYWRIRLYKKHPSKTINDSYTPQSLKIQVFSIPFFFFFSVLSFFQPIFWLVPLCILCMFVFHSIPFIRLFRKKQIYKIIFHPCSLVSSSSFHLCRSALRNDKWNYKRKKTIF